MDIESPVIDGQTEQSTHEQGRAMYWAVAM